MGWLTKLLLLLQSSNRAGLLPQGHAPRRSTHQHFKAVLYVFRLFAGS
jgi:hypothetical protein